MDNPGSKVRVSLVIDMQDPQPTDPVDAAVRFRNMSMQTDATWLYLVEDLDTGEKWSVVLGAEEPMGRVYDKEGLVKVESGLLVRAEEVKDAS